MILVEANGIDYFFAQLCLFILIIEYIMGIRFSVLPRFIFDRRTRRRVLDNRVRLKNNTHTYLIVIVVIVIVGTYCNNNNKKSL